jgi:LAO/AO transport system kinase
MTPSDRVSRVRAGDRRALAALMRDLDDERPGASDEVRVLNGPAPFIVGVTGPPGSGKSTLVGAIVEKWRLRGDRVGVVTVDPSSPIGGGAVLADRVRMQRHATDEGVFLRSLGTRGATGGLSRSAVEIATVLAAGGFPSVLIETVGVGQAEIEIARVADVTLLVTVPGLGDDVQTLKSGMLEMADILVVNKADLPGADRTVADLQAMLELRHASAVSGVGVRGPTEVPIVGTVALSAEGLAALVGAIDDARARVAGSASPRRRQRAEARIRGIVTARLEAAARLALRPGGSSADLADDVAASRIDPDTAADTLMARLRRGY